MKVDETLVYLWFMDYGEDASIVTRAVGLEPTYVCVPGQPNAQTSKMIHRVHKWEFYSPLPTSAHIDEHFEALLKLLEPRAPAINKAACRWSAGLNAAVIYYQDFTPGIHFSADSLRVIASLNLPIDLDLYFLGE